MRTVLSLALALAVCGTVAGQAPTITTVAGNGVAAYSGDNGPATSASIDWPAAVAIDSAGNLYIAGYWNHSIRKVSKGVITTVAGNGTDGYSGDNGPATSAKLSFPAGLAIDSAGNLYIGDSGNHRVRRVSNGVITTVAGTGTFGYTGDNGPASSARLNTPCDIAFDSAGNLYIADAGNARIRKVSGGVITTVAGTGIAGFSGDNGPATSAQLFHAESVAVDSAGNLYIGDSGNNRVRKVSNGVITTVAGNGIEGYGGDNGPATSAKLNGPGVTVDSAGNLYIPDWNNHRVRKVSSGVITTVAGNGLQGYGGDNGPATSARLNHPGKVALDPAGNVFIADGGNHRVRKVGDAVLLATVSAASFTPSVPLAPGAIAAGYGSNLVSTIEVASPTGPLPTVLAQTSVRIRDSAGAERTAPLWFVSPSQINYYIAEETSLGLATVTVVRNSQTVAGGTLQIERVAPGLFTMNASGQGVPAALAIFARGDGSQTWQYVFNTECQVGSCQPVPLDLGAATDQMFLQLYGTGMRGRSSLAAVTARIGGADAAVEYADEVSGLVGLDQVNLRVPHSLAGRGQVDIILTVDGKTANAVRVNIR
jgi:trimeric autotransporter adhesin